MLEYEVEGGGSLAFRAASLGEDTSSLAFEKQRVAGSGLVGGVIRRTTTRVPSRPAQCEP